MRLARPVSVWEGAQHGTLRSPLSLVGLARALPKAELHLHLDGSLSPGFVAARAAARGVELPCAAEEMGRFSRNRRRTTMAESLRIFDLMNRFLQTEAELEEATRQVLEHLAADHHIRYAEIRFCPSLHVEEGLSVDAAVAAVQRGFGDGLCRRGLVPGSLRSGDEGRADGTPPLVRGGVVVCALRSLGPEHALEMAEVAARTGALAMDVAGNEQDFPLRPGGDEAGPFDEAFALAAREGVPLVPHAGEWPGTTLPNLAAALDYGAVRVGHGLELHRDPGLVRSFAQAGIAVECCMTANIGGGRAPWYHTHPVRMLYDAGVRVTINSDNLLVSGSLATGPASPTGEVARLMLPPPDGAGFALPDVLQVLRNGFHAALGLDPDARTTLACEVDEALAAYEAALETGGC